MRWINRTQSSFSESFFPVLNGRYFLFLHSPLWASKYHFAKFHKSSLSERFLEGKAVTFWDELTEHKAVSQKSSFQFLTEDMSFFTIALYGLPNITLQIPQEQSSGKASGGETCNTVRWINTTHSSFPKSFFPVLTEDISFFTIALYEILNITFQIPHEQS